MSLRAEFVRLGLRWFVKRKIGSASTLEALRRQDAFLERLVPPPPKDTQATRVDLDGVKAVAVVTPRASAAASRFISTAAGTCRARRRFIAISPGASPRRRAPARLS